MSKVAKILDNIQEKRSQKYSIAIQKKNNSNDEERGIFRRCIDMAVPIAIIVLFISNILLLRLVMASRSDVKTASKTVASSSINVKKLNAVLTEINTKIKADTQAIDKLTNANNVLLAKIRELESSIRDLRAMPKK